MLEAAGGGYYHAPSASMEPNVMRGDAFLALPLAWSPPQRGDVVVFRHPKRAPLYVKRIIGVPGDTVQMVNGVPVLNGRPLVHRRSGPSESVEEALPGARRYRILDTARSLADNTAPVRVSPGHLFVLGDHRDNALDSRFDQMGLIPLTHVKSRVWAIVPHLRGMDRGSDLFTLVR